MKIVELLMRENLPQRNFFQASEISTLLNIKPHEIRYWETEFPQIRSQKSKNGQRIYRRQDVILFSAIKHLLQEKKLTLAGAQKILADSEDLVVPRVEQAPPSPSTPKGSDEIRDIFSGKSDRILEEASRFLDENDEEFDELAHQAYQQCSDVFSEPTTTNKQDGVVDAAENRGLKNVRPARSEYDKTLAILMDSKHCLLSLLESLEKFCESDFGQGFKEYSASPAEQRLKDALSQKMTRY